MGTLRRRKRVTLSLSASLYPATQRRWQGALFHVGSGPLSDFVPSSINAQVSRLNAKTRERNIRAGVRSAPIENGKFSVLTCPHPRHILV